MTALDTRPDPHALAAAVLDRAAVHQVQVFGAFSVQAPGGALVTPAGRKARALLACVLLSPSREAPRERLAALLWSKRGEDQARASLRQTLYELRPLTVGDAPLLRLDRTHVRLAASEVRSDLDRLREVARAVDARSLATLVGDQPLPLLRDFDGIDPAFDEWLAVERVQRHDERRQLMLRCGGAATATASTTGSDADADGAQHLAAALLAVDPFDEAAARLAMEAAHRRGDRDGVRVAHGRLETALRHGLGISPSAETLRLREQLMATPVEAWSASAPAPLSETVPADSPPAPAPAPAPPTRILPSATLEPAPRVDPRPAASRWPPTARYRMALAALALLIGAVTWQGRRMLTAPLQRVLRVDALKVPAADKPAQALGLGLAAELARVIVGNDSVLVVSDASAGAEGGGPLGSLRGVDKGRSDDAEIVVTGEARSSGGLLHANLRLVARDGGAILWSNSFVGAEAEIEPLREQMATKLADVALCAIGGSRNPTLDVLGVDTMRLYLGGCEHKHGDWAQSAKLLRQVTERRPDFAHAWAMLAAATAVSAERVPDASAVALRREVDDYAARALALDPKDGEAYFGRAMAMPGVHRWLARQTVLDAGHAAEPDNAQLHSAFGKHLAEVGRVQEAIAYAQRGVELDPFSPGKAAQLATLLAFGGDVLDAQVLIREQRRRFPQSEVAARTELLIEAFVGDPRRAGQLLAEAKGRVDMTARREAMWRALIDARQEPSTVHTDAAVAAVMGSAGEAMQSRIGLVVRLAALGRTEQAVTLAESLSVPQAETGDPSLLFWSVAAPLRADPRFMSLAARYGLAAVWLKTERWPDFCNDHSVGYDCRAEALAAVASLPKVQ